MIILDAYTLKDRDALHAELKRSLRLPEYYGGNLDALNDCLGEKSERELIVIEGAGSGHNLGMSQYGAKAMAEAGYDYDEILEFYFTDVTIE